MRWIKAVVALALMMPAAAAAQQSGPLPSTSSADVVQGTGDVNRGAPVNVRQVLCSGATCTALDLSAPLRGASGWLAAQVAVPATTPTLVAPFRAGRTSVSVSTSAAVACSFNSSSATAASGFRLQPVAGATLTLATTAEVWASCASAVGVDRLEVF